MSARPRDDDPPPGGPDEPPPVLGRWSRLYALVLGALAAQIAIYWAFTKAFE